MRNKFSRFVIVLFIFFPGISIFNSCSKKTTAVAVCASRPPDKYIDLSFNSSIGGINFKQAALWRFASVQHNADFSYPNLNELLPGSIRNGSEPFLVVLYIDKLLEESPTFSEKNILAYSKFTLDGKWIQHDFFQKENDKYKKIDFLSLKVSMITDNAIEFIRNNIVFKDNSSNTTVFSISNGKKLNYQSRNRNDYLYKAAKSYAGGNAGN